MPAYEIHYAPDPNKVYPVGPHFDDKEEALDAFNRTDSIIKSIGPFTFDDTAPLTDYYLVERTPGGQKSFTLYKASQGDVAR